MSKKQVQSQTETTEQQLKFRLEGVSALMMHNGQLVNPLNEWVRKIKKITAKGKKKTDADLEELAYLEFMGGLYMVTRTPNGNPNDVVPGIPGECIEGMVKEGAKRARKGKDVERAVWTECDFPLTYEGPTDPDELWNTRRFSDFRCVSLNKVRVMRCRPRFENWKLDMQVSFRTDVMNKDDVVQAVADAGRFAGLCDGRPKFGRFNVVNAELVV